MHSPGEGLGPTGLASSGKKRPLGWCYLEKGSRESPDRPRQRHVGVRDSVSQWDREERSGRRGPGAEPQSWPRGQLASVYPVPTPDTPIAPTGFTISAASE